MENYRAWKTNPDDFFKERSLEDKMRFLVRFGILAPSSHNTQPWKFKIGNNAIRIYADFSRRLPKSDKDGRMLYTALGCAAENIRIAAEYFGFKTNVSYDPTLGHSAPKHVLLMSFSSIASEQKRVDRQILEAIMKRSSYRGTYVDIDIPESLLDMLSKLNDKDNIYIHLFEGAAEKSKISLIVGRGMKNLMSDNVFRKELAQWVRNNFTCKSDGMPGFTHGLNFIKTLLAPFILRNKDVSEAEKKKIEKRVINFPVACIISSAKDNALSWVQCGEMLERILIHAYAQDLGASIIAAPIEDKDAREGLKKIVSEKSGQDVYPQVFFGFGYPQKRFPFSPRRKLEEVIINE